MEFKGQFYNCVTEYIDGWVYREKRPNAPDHDDDMVLWSDVLEWMDSEQLAHDKWDKKQTNTITRLRQRIHELESGKSR